MRRTLVQVTVAVPPVPVETLFAVAEGPRTLWEPRDPGAGARAFAGVGAAARLEVQGPDRFTDLAVAAEPLWADLEDARAPGCDDAPPPSLFGGFAFAPRASWGAPWTAFGDGSFTLPRVVLVTETDRAFLRVVAPAAQGLVDARDEARRLAGLVAAAATAARARRSLAEAPCGCATQHTDLFPADAGAEVVHMRPGMWRTLVSDALRRIDDHELDKLVAARCSVVRTRAPIDVGATLARLRGPAQPGVLFAHERGGATFLGLSPERLVARRGTRVTTEALAGTGSDPVALLASDKDRREHAIVVDGVRRALAPLCRALVVPERPRARALPGLHHLWTPIEGELARPTHVLELVRRLHPTPAVAGQPASAAVAWIGAHEPVPRGWYAGPVGHFDATGDGDFAVAIRSGVVAGTRAFIWAGAGIVPASDPDREWEETRAKQRALLGALGVTA